MLAGRHGQLHAVPEEHDQRDRSAPNLVCTITDTMLPINPSDTDGDGNAGTIQVELANQSSRRR